MISLISSVITESDGFNLGLFKIAYFSLALTRSKVEKVNMNFYIKLSIKTLDNVQFLEFLKKDKSN